MGQAFKLTNQQYFGAWKEMFDNVFARRREKQERKKKERMSEEEKELNDISDDAAKSLAQAVKRSARDGPGYY